MTTAYSRRSFLAGVLATGTLSAGATFLLPGGRSRSKSVEGRIRLWTGEDLTGAHAAVVGMWNEANPDATVDWEQIEGGSRAEHDGMIEKKKNGEADVVSLDIIDIREFAKDGHIKPVPLLERTYFQVIDQVHRVSPGSREYWAVPFNSDVGMLFSRATADLDLGKPLLPQVISKDAQGRPRFVGQLAPERENDKESFVVNVLEHALSMDSSILGADGRISEDLDRWRAALGPLRQAALNNDLVRSPGEGESQAKFESDISLAYMRNWPVRYRGLKDRVDLHRLPNGILGGQSLALVANARDVEAATSFIKFATGPAAQRVIAAYGLAPALESVYNDGSLKQAIPHLGSVGIALEQARLRPVHSQYRQFADLFHRHMLSFLSRPGADLTVDFIEQIKGALDPDKK
ncbi:type 2 periplasmic-binding domain-containing protein [Plantactinospora sonchi]|uniref:ABC transporter substrate-binding protein n=1 Tax=Plantactinospora sonchi TaxID=1544735 RepID=A0ABU7RWE2_9ACTN